MFQTEFVETIKTQCYVKKLFSENCAVYKIMWKNMLPGDKSQMTI
jgi:hypothetical protein